MNLSVRIVFFLLLTCGIAYITQSYLQTISMPQAHSSVEQLNGGDAEYEHLQQIQAQRNWIIAGEYASILLLGALIIGTWRPKPGIRYSKYKSTTTLLLCGLAILGLTGCEWRKYDVPEYKDIDTTETAFLIKLEGAADQQKFQSIEMLKQAMCATKRVQITHRFNKTGYYESEGEWIPDVKLITVKRTPVTREWTKDPTTGTAAKNQAVEIESKDSINFSMGWTCTAFIDEKDTPTFLYYYPAGSLEQVMDTEVLSRIQTLCQNYLSSFDVLQCRLHKSDLHKHVLTELQAFYNAKGITIANVGIKGGFTYDNPAIQKAMDETVVAENLKAVEANKLAAQEQANLRIQKEAEGRASAVKAEAQGKADAILLQKKAEAEGIRMVNDALNEAKQNPLLVQMKQLEIQLAQNEKWDGKYPTFYVGSGGNMPNMMLQLPSPAPTTTAVK